MTRRLLAFTVSVLGSFLVGQTALAQDQIKLRSDPTKPEKGTISDESPAGIRIKGKDLIPESEIMDVIYDMSGTKETRLLKTEAYQPALTAEAKIDSTTTTTDRKKALSEALGAYRLLASKAPDSHAKLKRHAQWKVASLTAQQALEEGLSLDQSIKLLQKFKDKNAGGWQIVRCLKLLGQLLVEADRFDDAQAVYTDLPPKLPKSAREQCQLLAARVSMRPGKYARAQATLQAMIDKLPDASPQKLKAQIYQAECLAGEKKSAEARQQLNKILDEAKGDKALRALAYNTLGYCHYLEGPAQYKDALWAFLRVDVVYYQDREEHARALYYLADLFAKLKEGDQAKNSQEKLKSKNFAGTEYQRRLLKDLAKAK
jgi:hypothetical protein